MESVPYEFVSNVLCKLDETDLHKVCKLCAPSWTDAARTQLENIENFVLRLVMTPDSAHCQILGSMDKLMTYEDLLKMDPRYVRIKNFQLVFEYMFYPDPKVPRDKISQLIMFISQFCLERTQAELLNNVTFNAEQKSVLDEMVKCNFSTRSLYIRYIPGSEDFMQKQLQNKELTDLNLDGLWPQSISEDLEAFVCRPHFRKLSCSHNGNPIFEFDHIKRIITYWKGMTNPWTRAAITMPTTKKFQYELVKEMPDCKDTVDGFGETNGKQFTETIGRRYLEINCYEMHTNIKFLHLYAPVKGCIV